MLDVAGEQQKKRTFEVQKDDRDVILHPWQWHPVMEEKKKPSTSKKNLWREEDRLWNAQPPFSRSAWDSTTSRGHHYGVSLLSQSQAPLQQLGLPFHVVLVFFCSRKDEKTQSNMNRVCKYLFTLDQKKRKKRPSLCALPALLTRLCRCWSRYSCLLVRAANHCLRRRSRSRSCTSQQIRLSVRGSTITAASSVFRKSKAAELPGNCPCHLLLGL